MNAIQDRYADLANLGQNVQVATLAVGELGLQVIRFGAGEARLTGALRTDGVLRGLGGVLPGAFSTTQRDSIAAGSRPAGMAIFNTTTNQWEINAGSDAAPSWQGLAIGTGVTSVPVGGVIEWPWAAAAIPTWALLSYGQAISRTTYALLAALASGAGYPYGAGDGSTTFNTPDMRGRVAVGKDDMGGTAANRITIGISGVSGATLGGAFGAEGITLATAHLPAHNHGIIGAPGITDPGHFHNINSGGGGLVGLGPVQPSTGSTFVATNGATTGITVSAGTLGTSNTGSGTAHQNTQPSIIVNKLIRAL